MAALRNIQERALSCLAEPNLYQEQEAKIAALEAENRRLRAALTEYADADNWCLCDENPLCLHHWIGWTFGKDMEHGYNAAREALKP